MERVNIDMWYGDKPEQVTGLDICFNDLGGFYCGNLRIFGKIVGDYYSDRLSAIVTVLVVLSVTPSVYTPSDRRSSSLFGLTYCSIQLFPFTVNII